MIFCKIRSLLCEYFILDPNLLYFCEYIDLFYYCTIERFILLLYHRVLLILFGIVQGVKDNNIPYFIMDSQYSKYKQHKI